MRHEYDGHPVEPASTDTASTPGRRGLPVMGAATLPPVVYVPVVEREEGLRVLLLEDDEGRIGVPAYTALDRFILALGEEEGWAVRWREDIAWLIDEGHADHVVVDPGVPRSAATRGEGREGGPRE
ncbi:SseB family protein [Georgenia sp. Z1344]|uniref:SseB family protein n=1 Tax=Georgenia sp. Z1344 TaxID=3416706 RepID=UPI003CEDDB11